MSKQDKRRYEPNAYLHDGLNVLDCMVIDEDGNDWQIVLPNSLSGEVKHYAHRLSIYPRNEYNSTIVAKINKLERQIDRLTRAKAKLLRQMARGEVRK